MKPLKVIFVLCNQMLASSVTLPLEQLRAAEAFAKTLHRRYKLNIILASQDGSPVKTHAGISLVAQSKLSDITCADIVYFPALWRNPKTVLQQHRPITQWLSALKANQQNHAMILAGASTGCYFFAEAGLLDNKPATTHWAYFDDFSLRYREVILKRQHFITQVDNIFCSGSVNSLADITIHLIEKYFNHEIAAHVERHFFHEIRQNFDGPKRFEDSLKAHPDEEIAAIQTKILLQLESISIQKIVENSGMSLRNFNRRFKRATGKTPLAYIQKKRIDQATMLLKTTNLNINEIMYRVGYNDASHFIRLFKRINKVSPKEYRKTVRSKLFNES